MNWLASIWSAVKWNWPGRPIGMPKNPNPDIPGSLEPCKNRKQDLKGPGNGEGKAGALARLGYGGDVAPLGLHEMFSHV